ncbi:Nramp family divalent metal transporter [Aureispira sp. CCB-QB1]|uniref:Nramp family divalent metal transporter n=1 Tax=Aureispira sp. CCB-QB1 TaxID=1313421 RepID=UPI000696A8F4|nr:Nramp family divalent metal transporter [Aureispira sp. CCB-QB1]
MLAKLKEIGPGALVAAAFIGPGTVTTATIAGSSYGYTLLWAILFSIIATYILQEMTARLGLIGGMGLGEAIRHKIQHPILRYFAIFLVLSAILIGNAAYEAGNITGAVLGIDHFAVGLPFNPLILVIGGLTFGILFLGKYVLIERFLILLVSWMGLVFLIAAIAVRPNLMAIISGLFLPKLPDNSLLMVVGLIGTTVVPYNLFLHAASVQERWNHPSQLPHARWDLFFSILLGGLITMAILTTAAATTQGKNIQNTNDLASGLAPLLGNWSTWFLTLGFFTAGLSSAITAPLAAAFATSEILGWKKDLQSFKFRIVWMLVLTTGLLFSCWGFQPIQVITFAQIANGLLLPIIATFLLWIMNDVKIMGLQVNSAKHNWMGGLIIIITLLLGMKGIYAAKIWF